MGGANRSYRPVILSFSNKTGSSRPSADLRRVAREIMTLRSELAPRLSKEVVKLDIASVHVPFTGRRASIYVNYGSEIHVPHLASLLFSSGIRDITVPDTYSLEPALRFMGRTHKGIFTAASEFEKNKIDIKLFRGSDAPEPSESDFIGKSRTESLDRFLYETIDRFFSDDRPNIIYMRNPRRLSIEEEMYGQTYPISFEAKDRPTAPLSADQKLLRDALNHVSDPFLLQSCWMLIDGEYKAAITDDFERRTFDLWKKVDRSHVRGPIVLSSKEMLNYSHGLGSFLARKSNNDQVVAYYIDLFVKDPEEAMRIFSFNTMGSHALNWLSNFGISDIINKLRELP